MIIFGLLLITLFVAFHEAANEVLADSDLRGPSLNARPNFGREKRLVSEAAKSMAVRGRMRRAIVDQSKQPDGVRNKRFDFSKLLNMGANLVKSVVGCRRKRSSLAGESNRVKRFDCNKTMNSAKGVFKQMTSKINGNKTVAASTATIAPDLG